MSRRVVVLAVLVLAVGGYLVLRELPILHSEREQALAELRVFEHVPAVIDTVRVRQEKREILLVRAGERWFLESPIQEEVPVGGVIDLVERLVNTERWRLIARGVGAGDWEEYGLGPDSPGRVRIELVGDGERSWVDVGELTPGSHTVWVRRMNSDELEVCFEDLYDVANMSYQGLREPKLFDVTHDELTKMTFTTDAASWTAVRDSEGLWHLGTEDGPRLRRWVLEDVAFALAGLRVDGYLRDDLDPEDWSAYGLDQPWGTVGWEATEGRSGTLWLGNELGGGVMFGRRSGLDTVFQLAPSIEQSFDANVDGLIDHNPIGGNFLHAERIRVSAGEGYVDVIRQTPGARAESEEGPIPQNDYVQVTSRNLQLGLEEFQPLAEMIVPSGQDPLALLDPVEATMTIHWPDRDAELAIGQMAGGVWIAWDGALYQVAPDMLLRVREVLKLRDGPPIAN